MAGKGDQYGYDHGACEKYSGENRNGPEKSKIFEGGVGSWIQNRKTAVNLEFLF